MVKLVKIIEYLDYNKTFDELYDRLLKETGRGAVLIGTSYIDEDLKNFILKILPKRDKKYIDRLFNYPGPLHSFSAKIELSYAFRLIDERFYKSLNHLRKIRNDAAHSPINFSLSDSDIDVIFDICDGFKNVVHTTSLEMMVKMKIDALDIKLSEINGLNEDERKKIILSAIQKKSNIDFLEKELPHWKLIFGLSLLCGIIRFHSDETAKIIDNKKTWGSL